ncbi:MAG: AAA family ATPase [Pseudomonadota bacterium]
MGETSAQVAAGEPATRGESGAAAQPARGAALGAETTGRPPPSPPEPTTLAETGLPHALLEGLMCKTMYRLAIERPSQLAEALCLPMTLLTELIDKARDARLVEAKGQAEASVTAEMRWALTAGGRERALQALSQSDYVGPAPVPMEQYAFQVSRQSIRGETLQRPVLERVFSRLTLSEAVMTRLGPAANSGSSMLLYGPPGNGKSSIAEALCQAFGHHVWIPYAIEVDRQIITLYDPAVHAALPAAEAQRLAGGSTALRRARGIDPRWVACKRPKLIAGGELTLDMLDLAYSPVSRVYEAPMQAKAAGGVLVIDDFGRQRQHPQEIINRMIIPLESGEDFLSLNTGRKFLIPFDSLVVFSTNIAPSELVDDAALRRLRYKILVDSPDLQTFLKIFATTAKRANMALTEETLQFVLSELYENHGKRMQAFHPRFFCDQARAICAFEGMAPALTPDVLIRAWENLFPVD